MPNKRFYRYWSVQFLLCLLLVSLTRIPYLLGPHVDFDGDEAIVGIMAKDLLSAESIPVYFYGQQYGFSLLEVIAVTVGLIIFGNTVWALKFGGIFIFSVGLSFLLRLCIKQKIHILVSCILILVICCFPAWLLWSTKPRGGYLTAFAVSCILIYIFQTSQPTIKSIVISSVLIAIGIHAQLMIIFPIGICYIWWILRTAKMSKILLALLLFGICVVVFKLPAFMNEGYWRVPINFNPKGTNLKLVGQNFLELFNGSYFYELVFPLENILLFLSVCYLLIGFFVLILAMRKKNPGRVYIVCLALGGILSFLMIAFMTGGVYRYSLGLFTAFLFIVFLSLIQIRHMDKKLFSGIALPLVVIGLGCAFFIKNVPSFWLHPQKNDRLIYNQLIDQLKKRNCQHIFMLDPMMQWKLNYSGFSARCTSKKERINRYAEQVDLCHTDPGCKTSLVGFTGYFNYTDSVNDWNNKVIIVNDRFFIYEEPQERHLKAGRFE